MQTLHEIEGAIEKLHPDDVRKLMRWLGERAADAWDAQIESDAREGRLDSLLAEADAAIAESRVAEMP